jgi:TDG/mug DNA glycosylase family protein
MLPADEHHLKHRGVGITSIVPGASAKASDLSNDELREGGERLRREIRSIRPKVVALLGVGAYRIAYS